MQFTLYYKNLATKDHGVFLVDEISRTNTSLIFSSPKWLLVSTGTVYSYEHKYVEGSPELRGIYFPIVNDTRDIYIYKAELLERYEAGEEEFYRDVKPQNPS